MMFRLLPAAAMTATALAGMTAGAATVDVYGVVDTGLHTSRPTAATRP